MLTKSQRSQVMAAVRGHGNRTTELKLIAVFRAYGITGWRRSQRIVGKPDFVFRRERIALFVDGCFWHGCKRHLRMPVGNRGYWRKKLARNVARDSATTRELKKAGWRVVRVWEHSLRKPGKVAERLKSLLSDCSE